MAADAKWNYICHVAPPARHAHRGTDGLASGHRQGGVRAAQDTGNAPETGRQSLRGHTASKSISRTPISYAGRGRNVRRTEVFKNQV
ncbi:hypothetical protein CSE45_0468 [Citreicella sp. SE45]|nr:hypothetical protein CSE45_0468 [Citreicella sp. SE45]